MPAPTNPRKRALMPSSPLRRALRAAGHHLSAVVQVGKEGVTPAVVAQLAGALAAHELVKVKIGTESPEDRFEAAERLGRDAGAQVAQILGRTVLAYRRHPEKPRFEPLTAAERDAMGLLEVKLRRERGAKSRRERRATPARERGAKPARERGTKPTREWEAKPTRERGTKPTREWEAKPTRERGTKPTREWEAKPTRGPRTRSRPSTPRR